MMNETSGLSAARVSISLLNTLNDMKTVSAPSVIASRISSVLLQAICLVLSCLRISDRASLVYVLSVMLAQNAAPSRVIAALGQDQRFPA